MTLLGDHPWAFTGEGSKPLRQPLFCDLYVI